MYYIGREALPGKRQFASCFLSKMHCNTEIPVGRESALYEFQKN